MALRYSYMMDASYPVGFSGVQSGEGNDLPKAIRNLKKKIRQCETLLEKQEGGQELGPEQLEKLGRLSVWQAELKELDMKEAADQ